MKTLFRKVIAPLTIILAVIGSSMAAQAEDQSLPFCETSTGKPGQIFESIHGYVKVPHEFTSAQPDTAPVRVFHRVTSDERPMVFIERSGPATLEFFNEGMLVHACKVEVVPFDTSEHPLSAIEEGNCDWQFDRDFPMLTSLARYIGVPNGFIEISTDNLKVLSATPTSDRGIYALGRSPGVATIVALDIDGKVLGQCPYIVQDSETHFAAYGIDDALKCRDTQGKPLRLKPGETTIVEFDKPGFREAAISDLSIAAIELQSRTKIEIKALRTGVVNIITLKGAGTFHGECMVVVQ